MSEGNDQGNGNDGGKGPGLTGVAMLVVPLLTAVSGLALTGTIGRVQRDEPKNFAIAIGLVIAAGTVWVLASTLKAPRSWKGRHIWDALLKLLALSLAAIGFYLAINAAIDAANNEPRPQITSTLSEDRTKLTVNVKASNLATEKRLAIRVDLLSQEGSVGEAYEAYLGPDGDGNIDHTATIPLPKSGYSRIGVRAHTGSSEPKCVRTEEEQREKEEADSENKKADAEDRVSGTGCVIITLPKYAVWD